MAGYVVHWFSIFLPDFMLCELYAALPGVYLAKHLNWQHLWCTSAHTLTYSLFVSLYSFPSLLLIPIDMG